MTNKEQRQEQKQEIRKYLEAIASSFEGICEIMENSPPKIRVGHLDLQNKECLSYRTGDPATIITASYRGADGKLYVIIITKDNQKLK